MMLTKKDLTAIDNLIAQRLSEQDKRAEKRFSEQDKKFVEQDKKFKAVEEMFQEQRKATSEDIGSFIADSILPQLDQLSSGINEISGSTDRIERRLEKQQDQLDNLGLRVTKLEKIHPHGKHISRN